MFREVPKSKVPYVIGLIDGTHVSDTATKGNEEQSMKRHDDHSFNRMLVCGSDLKVS